MEQGSVWLRFQIHGTAEFIGKAADSQQSRPTTAVVDALKRVDEDATHPLCGVETALDAVGLLHHLQREAYIPRAWLTKFFEALCDYSHKKKTPISGGRISLRFAPD